MHGTVGLTTCIQGLIHVIIYVWRNRFDISDSVQLYGLLSIGSFAILIFLTGIRRWFYETFLKAHSGFAILAAIMLWRHMGMKKVLARLHLLIGLGIFLGTSALHTMMLLARNVTSRQFGSKARIFRGGDIIRVELSVARPFKVQAGQSIYVWIPRVSFWSHFQTHPFVVVWDKQDDNGKAPNISLLIKERGGFTSKLSRHNQKATFMAWIDGPYGIPLSLGKYTHALMVATGIGIVSLIPCIREFVEAQKQQPILGRTILVAWEPDGESDLDWVKDWMDQLLQEDKGNYILRFGLYRHPRGSAPETDGQHDRIWNLPVGMDPKDLVTQEYIKHKRSLIIAGNL
ncbi:FAD-binding domain-containing protein [Histoplasma capsulatum G186AR]|uniref:ferric-chelate reductase (NADPH) n=1 Tax=Ajellomyces capsulatus TaxID=5037 RepID=A0A8H7YPT4_AJECA|nr:FAD-binding domain-containing protein [Histoplasma capsulatum]QSS75460.1 FAD-binding domain-containing protein [Histoplasma capsulatum G186AR]